MNVINHTKYNANKIYVTYPMVKLLIDKSNYYLKNAVSYFNDNSVEPYDNYWISTSILLKENDDNSILNFVENYTFYNNIIDKIFTLESISKKSIINHFILKSFYNIYESIKYLNQFSKDIMETMILLKMEDKYICYLYYKNNDNINTFKLDENIFFKPTIQPLHKSNVKFLSIEYNHPKLEKPISIELTNEYYYVNNQILSALFINRYLKYNEKDYCFDMDYTINIMDDNLNIFTINSNQFIFLDKTEYQICNIR
jgi:hypothetical protein